MLALSPATNRVGFYIAGGPALLTRGQDPFDNDKSSTDFGANVGARLPLRPGREQQRRDPARPRGLPLQRRLRRWRQVPERHRRLARLRDPDRRASGGEAIAALSGWRTRGGACRAACPFSLAASGPARSPRPAVGCRRMLPMTAMIRVRDDKVVRLPNRRTRPQICCNHAEIDLHYLTPSDPWFYPRRAPMSPAPAKSSFHALARRRGHCRGTPRTRRQRLTRRGAARPGSRPGVGRGARSESSPPCSR